MTYEQFEQLMKKLSDIETQLAMLTGAQQAGQITIDFSEPCLHIHAYHTSAGLYCPNCGETLGTQSQPLDANGICHDLSNLPKGKISIG